MLPGPVRCSQASRWQRRAGALHIRRRPESL
jgi:hypothetical protein